MKTENVSWFSDGDRISGLLRLPDEAAGPFRAIVQGPGWLGLKDAKLYERYHQAFTEAGFGVLVIDYRGFGDSDGDRTLSPPGQLTDLLNAVTYLTTRERSCATRSARSAPAAPAAATRCCSPPGSPRAGGRQPGPGRRRRRLAAPDAQRARVAVLPRGDPGRPGSGC